MYGELCRTSEAPVRQIVDTVSVLHNGRQVDAGPVEDVFRTPRSDYTRELIDAFPGRRLSFAAFGLDSAERSAIFGRHLQVLLDAWGGRPLDGASSTGPTA